MALTLPVHAYALLHDVIIPRPYGRNFQRWVQPAQQQGLRIPPLSFESAFLMRIPLVSAFLPEITQQIHSLRASGVMSSHTARALGVAVIAFRRSAGIVCTVPPAIPLLIIRPSYQIPKENLICGLA